MDFCFSWHRQLCHSLVRSEQWAANRIHPNRGNRPMVSGYYFENEDLGFFKYRKIIVGNQYERSVAVG